ncbi:MAG: radical SAM protein [Deltaproteobacteria bacterium]|nr:radical SAM protein [Deltaproteobacteria bacterium]
MAQIKEIQAKSILRKHKRVDSWFASAAGMNLYRGCAHDCAYCDGRAERYRVEGEFGRDVAVKTNAPEILRRELDPRRKRVPLRRAFILIGGGVGDAYQPAEESHELARAALSLIEQQGLPAHVLTKSSLVERDFDLLERIAARSRAIVSTSLTCADDELSRVFEPGCSPPSRRLETLVRARSRGLATGVYLMPVIPLVTDTSAVLDATLEMIARAEVDFVMFGGMTLKPGRQTEHFLSILDGRFPELVPRISAIYTDDQWGNARGDYYQEIEHRFGEAAKRHRLARRIPLRLLKGVLDENDLVVVVLENLEYLCKLDGRPAPYGRAARAVASLDGPISAHRDRLQELPGVGGFTAKLIEEIIDTGGCGFHEEML